MTVSCIASSASYLALFPQQPLSSRFLAASILSCSVDLLRGGVAMNPHGSIGIVSVPIATPRTPVRPLLIAYIPNLELMRD